MITQEEEWRPVVGFADYMVSDKGRVASIKRGEFRILTGGASVSGYRNVLLYKAGDRTMRRVHTLVADAFHGPRPDGLEIRHLDGDMLNNAASNLRYGSHAENLADQQRHRGRLLIVGPDPVPAKYAEGGRWALGAECARGHVLNAENVYRYPGRSALACRPCMTAHARAARERRMFAAANVQTAEIAA